MGNCIGSIIAVIQGDTRSLDYSSFEVRGPVVEGSSLRFGFNCAISFQLNVFDGRL